jgi:hypothetical protein
MIMIFLFKGYHYDGDDGDDYFDGVNDAYAFF